jgi:oligoendopeptidase F
VYRTVQDFKQRVRPTSRFHEDNFNILTFCTFAVRAVNLRTPQDFKQRVRAYEQVYETIEDHEDNFNIQYIKLYNVGQKVVTRNCKGYLPSQVAFYLQNIHISPRKVCTTLELFYILQN